MHIKKTLNLPKELLEEAVKLSGATTQTMAVILGLQELIQRKKLETIMQFKGKNVLGLTHDHLSELRGR